MLGTWQLLPANHGRHGTDRCSGDCMALEKTLPHSGLPLPQERQLRVQAQERVSFLSREKASGPHPVEVGRPMPVGTSKRDRMRDPPKKQLWRKSRQSSSQGGSGQSYSAFRRCWGPEQGWTRDCHAPSSSTRVCQCGTLGRWWLSSWSSGLVLCYTLGA